jgi:hypothetical protein
MRRRVYESFLSYYERHECCRILRVMIWMSMVNEVRSADCFKGGILLVSLVGYCTIIWEI